MADILANPVEICFGSFTATLTTLAAVTLSNGLHGGPDDLGRRPQFWQEVEDPPTQTL
jgi:hypothetical protein